MNFLEIFGFLLILANLVYGNLNLSITSEEPEEKICGKHQVCNLVYSAFDQSEVEKFCHCPQKPFCPTTFDLSDGYSLSVNRRTQMKFCTKVEDMFKEMENCETGKPSLQVRKMYEINKIIDTKAELKCKCNKNPIYWTHTMRSGEANSLNEKMFEAIDDYECTALPKCETNDFCGLARTDFGFIFQRCTCSQHDTCQFYVEDSELENDPLGIIEGVEELFYSDLFYKSYCIRKESSKVW